MKTIYYSPFGGEVFAVLNGSAGDPDYEEQLRSSGTKFKKKTVADSAIIKDAASGTFFDEAKGRQVAQR